MKASQLELTIAQLILHDAPPVAQHHLLAAIEEALQRLLAARGLPADMARDTITVPAASVQIEPGASVETLASQIAQSVYASLQPGADGAAPVERHQSDAPGWAQPGEENRP